MSRQSARPEITLDQRVALRAAALSLSERFAGLHSVETVQAYLYSSYDELADRAATAAWLPLLAERFARVRLHALARVEGVGCATAPVVLFVCRTNAGRSQMAMGWFGHYAGERAVAWSAGADPASQVNPAAVDAMAEVGVDISREFPKPWTEEIVRAADVVVTMACGDRCPVFPGTRYLDWAVDDPAGLPVEQVRPIRDQIERRVLDLLDEMSIDTSA